MIFQRLFDRPTVRSRHEAAPLRAERNAYLEHLVSIGVTRRRVQCAASTLLHVVRVLCMEPGQQVTTTQVAGAMVDWSHTAGFRKRTVNSDACFRAVANRFLQFHGLLVTEQATVPFGEHLEAYLRRRKEEGLRPATLSTQKCDLTFFLRWLGLRLQALAELSGRDIDDYFTHRREGRSNNSVATEASGVRSFLEFLAGEGLCDSYLPAGVTGGNRSLPDPPAPPQWSDVRRMLEVRVDSRSDTRMRAMLLLCSVYGFRTSEACNLKLNDLDWRQGVFTVVRSKNSRVQRFPIVEELRTILLAYLKERPVCTCEALFVSVNPPYRRVKPGLISMAAEIRFQAIGLQPERRGAHALRHACASQLLRSGMALPELADFLGHRGVSTVSRYAKHDCASLAEVSNFSLSAVL